MTEPRPFRIGELSAQSGLSRDALQYYEHLGLMTRARRTTGGFRLYPPGTLDRIRFINVPERSAAVRKKNVRSCGSCQTTDRDRRPSEPVMRRGGRAIRLNS